MTHNDDATCTLSKYNSKLSPHTLQKPDSYYSKTFNRVLNDDYPRGKYVRRKGQDKTTVHFGQRKLHLSEVEFLTIACKEIDPNETKIVMIYAGAASGYHIPSLINMFPFIEYVLIDPAKFHVDSTRHTGKVKFINDLFTDKLAHDLKKEYEEYTILFVSDIRSANYRKLDRNNTELKVEEDMINQMNWYRILDPLKAMFKFRLPYVEGTDNPKTEVEYLDGTVYFQVWPPPTSSETRLIVDKNAKIRNYDCKLYEDQLFYFNTVDRVLCYEHDQSIPGLDHCYDCKAEVYIYEEYTKIYDKLILLASNVDRTLERKTVKELIEKFNSDLDVTRRKVLLIYQKKYYHVTYSDVCYGKSEADIFNSKNEARGDPYAFKCRGADSDADDTFIVESNELQNKRQYDDESNSDDSRDGRSKSSQRKKSRNEKSTHGGNYRSNSRSIDGHNKKSFHNSNHFNKKK